MASTACTAFSNAASAPALSAVAPHSQFDALTSNLKAIRNPQTEALTKVVVGTNQLAQGIAEIVDVVLASEQTDPRSRQVAMECLAFLLRERWGYKAFNTAPFIGSCQPACVQPMAYSIRVQRLFILTSSLNRCVRHCPECQDLVGFKSMLFEKMLSHEPRCAFTLLLDKSGSMSLPEGDCPGSRWEVAADVADHIQEFIMGQGEFSKRRGTRHGIDLWLFSTSAKCYEEVHSDKQVEAIFKANGPQGSTNLTGCLEQVINAHFQKRPGVMENVFIVTDGRPNSIERVKNTISQCSQRIQHACEISITIIQIGEDAQACTFLHDVDDFVHASGQIKLDFVEVLFHEDLGGVEFSDFIHHYLPESGCLPEVVPLTKAPIRRDVHKDHECCTVS